MVDHELIERVTRLPVSQRLELIELLTHSLREELAAPVRQPSSVPAPSTTETGEQTSRVLTAVQRLARSYNLDVPADSSLHRILGVVPSDAVPMTKDERLQRRAADDPHARCGAGAPDFRRAFATGTVGHPTATAY